jgi:hypothetical protein
MKRKATPRGRAGLSPFIESSQAMLWSVAPAYSLNFKYFDPFIAPVEIQRFFSILLAIQANSHF